MSRLSRLVARDDPPRLGISRPLAALAALAVGLSIAPTALAGKEPTASNVVYVTSNNPDAGQNSVLAYRRDPATGDLTLFGNFLTRGAGFFVDDERLGPDDSDQEIIASPDRRLLFAVNSGSNTIAVFRVRPDGSLRHVDGSPFPSGGVQPVSLGLSGNKLYVVNKGDREPGESGGARPNYTGFRVNNNGKLIPIPKSTIQLPPGSHPTQALIAPSGNFLFGIDLFLVPFTPPPGFPPFIPPFASGLESFRIRPNGRLDRAPGTPQPAPPAAGPPFLLGLQVHPKQPLLYVGFVVGNAVGTYEYNAAGALSFVGASTNSGAAICWIAVNRAGTFAYTSNSATDSISAYSLADPRHPVEIQALDLKGPKGLLPPDPPTPNLFNTTPFQLALTPAGDFLYVVNHEATLEDNFPDGNALHILRVGPDGKLTEIPNSPVIFPQSAVPARAHPKGVVVF
jgi:DNA-binding beta-propeller fold protein YncE